MPCIILEMGIYTFSKRDYREKLLKYDYPLQTQVIPRVFEIYFMFV